MQHELEKFLVLVESGSFTHAADRLGVSQPALSVAIQKLEHSLGVSLLTRNAQGLHLTEAGTEVYASARRVRLELSQLHHRLDETRQEAIQKPLRVGMIDSIGRLLFGQDFALARPLEVVVDNSERLRRAVKLDQLELAFITTPLSAVEEELALRPVGAEQFVLVTAPSLVKVTRVKLQNQRHLSSLLTYNSDSTTYALIEQTLAQQKISSTIDFYSTNPELIRLLALAGRGVTLLPRVLVAEDLTAKRLIEIPGLSFARPVALIQRQNAQLSTPLQAIVQKVEGLLGG